MASRARLVRASNRRTPVSYRETTLWATPSMPPSSLCEIPSFFLTVRISIMVQTYPYMDIRVNSVIHKRRGESHMRELYADMNESSEERRVGQEWVRTFRARWSRD